MPILERARRAAELGEDVGEAGLARSGRRPRRAASARCTQSATKTATAVAISSAMLTTWPRSCQSSRRSLRVERAHQTISCGDRRARVDARRRPTRAVGEADDAVGHARPIAALWVMMTVVVPSSRLIRAMASSTSLPVVTSSAPVGSSQSRTSGRLAMARAMATRCCWPPDICAGKWSRRSPRPTRSSTSSTGMRFAGDLGDQRHVLARGEAGDEVVELEDEAHVVAAVAGELGVARRASRSAPR